MPSVKEKLRNLLDHARTTVPYYQTILFPITEPLPDDLRAYLETLPILSRRTVQTDKARLISSTGNTSSWRRIKTSGTSEEPLEVILDHESRIVEALLLAVHIETFLKSNTWQSGKVIHVALHPGSRSQTLPAPWHQDAQIIKWNLIRTWQQTDEKFFESLACFTGAVITIMPSVAEMLCSRILAANYLGKIQPLLVLLSGETIPENLRPLITKVFNCPVSSLYTMSEVGIVGLETSDHEGYSVAEESAIIEIVDNRGKRQLPGSEGEIVVTALNNLAMPLIRYRTGDRGYWIDENKFQLVQTRQPSYLYTKDGASVNVVRFAKIFASLNVHAYHFLQGPDRDVTFSYTASQPLDEAGYTLVQAVIRSSLGLETDVNVRHLDHAQFHQLQQKPTLPSPPTLAVPEPLAPNLNEIILWLRNRLSTEPQIEAAVLTGSILEQDLTTRFSDIDCVIFVQGDPMHPHWLALARHLKSFIPKLFTNIDSLDNFSKKSPLIACRLLCEQIPLIGAIDENILPWPDLEELRVQGIHWSQEMIATLWLRLVNRNSAELDLVYEAWFTTKLIWKALRYYYLSRGLRVTALSDLLEKVHQSPNIPDEWRNALLEMFQVSREIKPPPLLGGEVVENYLQTALSFIRFVQRSLMGE